MAETVDDIFNNLKSDVEHTDISHLNAKVVYNGPLGLLAIPKDKEAAQALGTGTKWCTSAKDDNMFDRYNSLGPLYIWKDKSGDKFQFWFNTHAGKQDVEDEHYEFNDEVESYQMMDARDVQITPQQRNHFKTHPVLSKIIKQVEASILLDPTSTLLYAKNVIKGRWKEGEKIIMTNPSDAKSYAIYIIKGRWPEAENVIAQCGHAAMRYAALVIKGRWPEAEPYIMKNPHQSRLYKNSLETLNKET